MTGLVEIAVRVVATVALAARISTPLGVFGSGRIHYDIRAVNNSTGLGGFPPNCGPPADDVLSIVYIVRNDGETALPAPAVPRLMLINPDGNPVRPDRAMSDALSLVTIPPMIFHHGVLAPHESQVRADVFLTPAHDIHYRVYRLKVDSNGEPPITLPNSTDVFTPECPGPSQTISLDR